MRFQSLRTADAGAVVAAMRSGFETRPEVREVRVLAHATEREGTNFLGLVASRVPPPAHLDLIGAYTPF
ncbi:hypothetical protein [Pseudoroseomonas ludipueritiae]|uniref:GNAT family N-acetyltransferase n=1 Tax=Pseudoroseomonas ludipueritiae TaxID=198093 RepID=A0ABR7R506_9PROT|nr:hypothetical protein [Pseudoroseomonas ludipueritiae]MBC9176859.1 hypothetical protein [Pseudoroseomonas ludipueritiae]